VRFLASDVAVATGGRLDGADVALSGTSFDSRTLAPGQLFVPLVADRDGHEFVAAAVAAGAPAYLCADDRPAVGGATAIRVADTAGALLRLGAWARVRLDERLAGRVVGITGSVGKTSAKDLTAAALATTFRVAASERSFNNDQGLPVTILNAPDDTEALVLEMGMRGHGEVARLCAVGRPHVGVVTTVAEAHGERVGGIEGVARAKAELVESLGADGVAVLNADDARVARMAAATDAKVLTFGEARHADVHVAQLAVDGLARPRFVAETPWGTADVVLGVSGRHMALNAAAAIAVAGVLGVDLDAAAGALTDASMSPMRMQLERLESGALVLNDAYNANPTSMRAALHTLAELPGRRRVAVLGVMAELAEPEADHLAIARLAHDLGVVLVPYGTDWYGVPPVADPLAALGPLTSDDVVLVKGSRVAGLERIVRELEAPAG
jgi:UDP-N-acetylmuramoyl-tripeptide--D-alanyl-D-alanine ligase